MTILKLFLETYHDKDCQSIKIKLGFLLDSEDKEEHNIPENLVKNIVEFYLNDINLKLNTLQFIQIFLSQYTKSEVKPKIFSFLSTINAFGNLENPDNINVEQFEELEKEIVYPNCENPFITTRQDSTFPLKNGTIAPYISLVYTLPTDPLLAIQLLTCLTIYFKQSNCLLLYPSNNSDIGCSEEEFSYSLLEKIVQFEDKAYDNTLNTLRNLYNAYKDSNISFKKYIKRNHSSLLWPTVADLLQSEAPTFEKINGLLHEARVMIHSGRQKELNQMLISLNYTSKCALIESCFGKPSYKKPNTDDEEASEEEVEAYHWGFTEFELLLDPKTQFTLRQDGLVSISKFQSTLGYQSFYAQGCENHAILKGEMRHLFNTLGLEFEDCDFHQEMVFTEESSKRLIAKGLHFTLNHVQNLMQVQNQAGFFKRHMQHMPQDALNIIAYSNSTSLDEEERRVVLNPFQ